MPTSSIYIYNPRVHTAATRRSGSRTRYSGAGGGRSNKERQRPQPLASVARAPLFEVRRVRFTHSPYWHSYIRYIYIYIYIYVYIYIYIYIYTHTHTHTIITFLSSVSSCQVLPEFGISLSIKNLILTLCIRYIPLASWIYFPHLTKMLDHFFR